MPAPSNPEFGRSVDEASARRLVERHRQRLVFGAVAAADLLDAAEVILGGFAIALFKLPQAVILPGADVVRVGLERALVPHLRNLVIAELAVGIADQVGDVGDGVMIARLQLRERAGVVVAIVDRGVGRTITFEELLIVDARALVALLFLVLGRT